MTKLPQFISDHMVLQRQRPIKVWGWDAPGQQVRIHFNDEYYDTVTGSDGTWRVELHAMEAGGPHQMQVIGSDTLTVDDILIGDVWICSGQSNMVIPMSRVQDLYKEEIATCDHTHIRLFTVPDQVSFKEPRLDVETGQWMEAVPEHILNFTAVGYFYAKTLYERYRIPIGLINASVGGSPIQAWMSESSLQHDHDQLEILQPLKDDDYVQQIKDNDERAIGGWYKQINEGDKGLAGQPWYDPSYDASHWKRMPVPAFWADEDEQLKGVNGVVWYRKEVDVPASMVGKPGRLQLGTIVDSDTAYINGIEVGTTGYQYPPRKYEFGADVLREGKNVIVVRIVNNAGKGGFTKDKPYQIEVGDETIDLIGEWQYEVGIVAEQPCPPQTFFTNKPVGLFNGMIAPLLPMSIKGVLWYQGESNVGEPHGYSRLLTKLISDWRTRWNQGDFPFLIVQLANFLPPDEEPATDSYWATLRHEQFRALSAPNTGLAVAIDLGEWNDIHPLNKKDVGIRLALAAQHIAYGDQHIVYSGPVCEQMTVADGKMTLSFKHVGSGLVARGEEATGRLHHFALAGADGQFVWADAIIDGEQVVVWSDEISDPVTVRYAWADNPATANLYNKEGLPAVPFEMSI